MDVPVVTMAEKLQWSKHWSDVADAQTNPKIKEFIGYHRNPDCIGYDSSQGQIRPGDLGRYDMYFGLCMFFNDMSQRNAECAAAVGLSLSLVCDEIDELEQFN